MPALATLGLALLLICLPAAKGSASTLPGLHSAEEGPRYSVGEVELIYARSHPAHPTLELLYGADFALGSADDGFVGPRLGGDNVWFTLRELAAGPPIAIYASGLRELSEQIVAELNALGVMGVFVAPHEEDIESGTGRDLRAEGDSRLRLVLYTGRVQALRTFAAGSDGAEARVNASEHARIRSLSPVQAGPPARAEGDLILRRELDEYLAYLNRHPGRRVDMNVTPSREPGGAYLDYLVSEPKPWQLYAQVSETGTESTGEWRQRIGFTHYQLTGRDDVVHFDYVTGADGFAPELSGDVRALFASYELPLPGTRRTRLGFSGSWSEYEASQLGFPDDAFTGDQWTVATELVMNLFQREDLFVDGVAGARWLDVEVVNLDLPGEPGFRASDQFFTPFLGGRLERLRDTSTLAAALTLEQSLPGIAGSDLSGTRLRVGGGSEFFGRADLDDDWWMVSWDFLFSFYLEPVLWPRAWHNPRTPESSTLAHELWFSVRGQNALGSRLIPQVQRTLGGLYTVRGYEQSLVTGDNVWNLQAEYRLHLPRLLRPDPAPYLVPLIGVPFRVRPDRVYARPDWDLIVRGFLDAGHAEQNDPTRNDRGEEIEHDETLSSVGLGLELQLYRYLALRFDYGWALKTLRARDVEQGDGEGYVSVTLRY
jgi:hypothetical protein